MGGREALHTDLLTKIRYRTFVLFFPGFLRIFAGESLGNSMKKRDDNNSLYLILTAIFSLLIWQSLSQLWLRALAPDSAQGVQAVFCTG